MRSMHIIILLMIVIFSFNQGWCQESSEATKASKTKVPGNFFTPIATGDNQGKIHDKTNFTVNKTVEGDGSYPILKYTLKTPEVDDFEFILALDSSGSMGDLNKTTQARAVAVSVPIFLKDIIEKEPFKNKDFRTSIISWDEDIDFIYGSNSTNLFDDTNKAKFVPVSKASKDIATNSMFSKYYYCNEAELTDFSVPIEACLDIFKNNPVREYYRTSRFIILVTGRSEFHSCNNDWIKRIRDLPIPVYVIGMQLYPDTEPELLAHLNTLAENNSERVKFISATSEQLEPNLLVALRDTLEKAIRRPVAENVVIVDSFYNYLDPDINFITINGDSTNAISKTKMNNSDGTKTITFGLAYGLLPNSETTVKIPLNFKLDGLPVSVTKNLTPVIIVPSSTTAHSFINFTWFNGERIPLELPEGHIDIGTKPTGFVPASNIDSDIIGNNRPSGNFWHMFILKALGLSS